MANQPTLRDAVVAELRRRGGWATTRELTFAVTGHRYTAIDNALRGLEDAGQVVADRHPSRATRWRLA